jgi:hypothetical protein
VWVVVVDDQEAGPAPDQVVPALDPLRVVRAGVVLLHHPLGDLLPGRAREPRELAVVQHRSPPGRQTKPR